MIQGVREIKAIEFGDERGIITEIFKDFLVKSVTHTISRYATLRGFHVQMWDKIIYPCEGEIYMVLLDARRNSASYGEKMVDYINEYNRKAYVIPKGVANLYCALTEDMQYLYFNSENYDENKTYGIAYNDPKLNISYPVSNPIVSEKDKKNPLFKDVNIAII